MQTIFFRHFRDGFRYAKVETASGERASIIEIKKATKKREAIFVAHIIGTDLHYKGTLHEIIETLDHI